MTLQEFRAWFEGFTENMGEVPPTKLQWARIQARVKEIDGAAITYPVFIDRYWPYQSPTIWPRWVTFNPAGTFNTAGSTGAVSSNMNTLNDGHTVFNVTQAMGALGQADYAAVQ